MRRSLGMGAPLIRLPDPLLQVVRDRFLPFHEVLFADAGVSAVAEMRPMNGHPAAYVCENFTCRLPTSDSQKLAELLK